MKGNIQKDGMWWSWVELCDRCGELIYDNSFRHSCEQKTKEADFCVKCMRHMLDNNISYEDAKKQYKKQNLKRIF